MAMAKITFRIRADLRNEFKAWCSARGTSLQAVLLDDVVRHVESPVTAPVPRDRALVRVARPWHRQAWKRLSSWARRRRSRPATRS